MSEPNDPDDGQVFSETTTMADAIRRDPNLPVVLMRFHVGGCSLCGFEPNDTIAQVAEDNGIPIDVLLAAINGKSQP